MGMPPSRKTIPAVIAATAAALGAALGAWFLLSQSGGSPSAKQQAPDFTIETFAGQPFRLSDQRGKRVVINFFASWCVTCGTEVAGIEKSYQEHKDKTAAFVGVAIDDEEEKAKAFLGKHQITYQAGIDKDGSIKKAYAIYGLPFTFFIDKDGSIAAIHAGAITRELLKLELDKMR